VEDGEIGTGKLSCGGVVRLVDGMAEVMVVSEAVVFTYLES
jgi:hypothetical protein